MEKTINISKQAVYDEVAKATDYTGSKMEGTNDSVRDRILAGDEDLRELGIFWEEARAAFEEFVKDALLDAGMQFDQAGNETDNYEVTFTLSESWDATLTRSLTTTIRSYFIQSIIAQWFNYANKDEAAAYMQSAAEALQTIERIIYTRRRPKRPTD